MEKNNYQEFNNNLSVRASMQNQQPMMSFKTSILPGKSLLSLAATQELGWKPPKFSPQLELQ
ncbi:hypothetical protein KUH03_40595 [Sphingobacterium sp. E70]|uniref:hypothetical protein n=1 Tax=Sphingobacterium sp. E70 TaxID=2853439 RepID=UPI00211BDB77|nr:hypothetical protein [Sphingobacterium sp. E70]ULT25089.1 hypothetical protein KUH03_40595 [Sphingobacterium sp. E70]